MAPSPLTGEGWGEGVEIAFNFVYNVPLARQRLRDLTRSTRKSGRP